MITNFKVTIHSDPGDHTKYGSDPCRSSCIPICNPTP